MAASKSKHRIFNSIWEAHNKTKSEQICMNEYHHFYCWMLLKCVSASCSRFFAGFNKRFFMQQPTRSFEEWGCHLELRHVHYFNLIGLRSVREMNWLSIFVLCRNLGLLKFFRLSNYLSRTRDLQNLNIILRQESFICKSLD